jgi:hypothetical protein
MTTETQRLADAPTNVNPPPEPKPESYTVEFLVETPEGFHTLFRGEGLTGKEMLPWMLATSKGLKAKGFLPVRRDMAVDVKVDAPQPAEAPGPRRGGGRNAGAGQQRPARVSKYTGEIYEECPWCNGDVYDNRQKKTDTPGWRGPWFKCKADCGFVVFKNDGTPNDD